MQSQSFQPAMVKIEEEQEIGKKKWQCKRTNLQFAVYTISCRLRVLARQRDIARTAKLKTQNPPCCSVLLHICKLTSVDDFTSVNDFTLCRSCSMFDWVGTFWAVSCPEDIKPHVCQAFLVGHWSRQAWFRSYFSPYSSLQSRLEIQGLFCLWVFSGFCLGI